MHEYHPELGKTFTLTRGPDRLRGTDRNDTSVAASDTLSGGDIIDGGGGIDTLVLTGGDGFDLSLPARSRHLQVVDAHEGVAQGGDTGVGVNSGSTATTFTMTGAISPDGFKLASDEAAGTTLTPMRG